MKEDEEVIEVGGRLPVRMTMDPAGNWVVVRLWGSFVVSSTTDRSLGRTGCAHWDTRDFSGRGLSKGTAIDYAVSHMPPRLPAVLPQGCIHCFEPGRRPRASRPGSRPPGIVFPSSLLCFYVWARCYAAACSAGLGPRFPVPNVVLACAALPYTPTPEFSHPGLSPSHNACFRGHNDLDRREAYKASAHLCPTVTVSHLW